MSARLAGSRKAANYVFDNKICNLSFPPPPHPPPKKLPLRCNEWRRSTAQKGERAILIRDLFSFAQLHPQERRGKKSRFWFSERWEENKNPEPNPRTLPRMQHELGNCSDY